MKNLLYLLLSVGMLISCQGQTKNKFINTDGMFWHLNRVMQISPEGDTNVTADLGIKNAFDQAQYEHSFLEFKENDSVYTHILSSHPASSEVQNGVWILKEAEQSMAYYRIARYYEPEKPAKDWQYKFKNEKTFYLYRTDEKGKTYLNEYQLKEKEIPGTELLGTVAEKASPGAEERGLKAAKISPEAYQAKRLEFLQKHPDSMDLPYRSATAVVGIVVEYSSDGETISLYADKNGYSEVYYSSGIKHSGGKNVGVLKDLAKKLAANSGRLWENMSPLKSTEVPTDGDIRFYIIHTQNAGEVYISQSRARTGHSDYQLMLYLSESLVNKYNTALGTL